MTTPTSPSLPLRRRDFLGATAAGLTLGFALPQALRAGDAHAATGTAVNTWLSIGTDDSITLTVGASDMGQGSVSGLAQVLAEDLYIDPTRVTIAQGAPTMANPAPVGAAINTVGSGVTRNNFWRLRDASAIARETLVQAAMNRHGDATRANYTVSNGVIRHVPSGAAYSYGQVAADAALLTPPTSAPLVPDSQFRSIGKTLPRADIPAKVDGSARYGIDVRLPGMVYAVIKHSPTLGGMLASTPATPAGMLAVVPTRVAATTGRGTEAVGNVNAVAVVGTNTWDAWQAAKRLTVNWTLPPNAAALNTATFEADSKALMVSKTPYVAGGTNGPGTVYVAEKAGGISRLRTGLSATYSLPFVAHATLEVLNCTVDYVAGVKCDVYAPTQSARTALVLVMALTGMTASQVSIKTTALGGGLGRKAEVDFISQAVQVGMALGRPVKLMWPREEDFTHDQYRPMAQINVRATIDPAGKIAYWQYRNVSSSILGQRGAVLPATGDSQGTESSTRLPYDFGGRLVEWVAHTAPIPVGFWRSVGASLNTFAVESMIDEVAAATGVDPLEFRRRNITDPRWLAVLEEAARLGNWGAPLPAGRARGIAIGPAFNSIVAQVVEISSVTATSLKVERVSVAIDCYLPVNPGSVEMQIIGGVVHGMNAALWGQQTFVNGVGQAKNFNRSRMMRMNEMPQVAVSIIPAPASADRAVPIGGVGELGVPSFAPALANAHARLTGARVRKLPFFPGATMSD